MAHSTAKSRPLDILYVAGTDADARERADALERAVDDGSDRTVHPATSIDQIQEETADIDCVVFGESATEDGGVHLLDVVEAIGSTPIVSFATSRPGATEAQTSRVFDGYVRRDTEDAMVHLLDEITWLCSDAAGREAVGSNRTSLTQDKANVTALETAATIVTCRERDRLFERLVEGAVDVLEFESCWVATINFGNLVPRATATTIPDDELEAIPLDDPLSVAFRARQSIRLPDLEALEAVDAPFDHVRSLCSVPVGDVGVLYVASELPDAFDSADLEVLEALCDIASATLERNWIETGIGNERDRLERERDRLADERDRIAGERDALRSLVASVSEPTIRYELVDGEPIVTDVNGPLEATFGDDAEAVVGASVVEYAVPSGLTEEATKLRESIRAGTQRELACRRETVDGIRAFVVTVVPLETAADGDDANGLLVYEDVTESRRRKRTVAATRGRLETVSELIDGRVRTPLNTASGYLELAEKTGDAEHFEMVEGAHEQLADGLDVVTEIATGRSEAEPVTVQEMAQLAWVGVDTGDARLVTEGDLVFEANREQVRELLEYVLSATIEVERGDGEGTVTDDDDGDPVTVTVGTTDDGFYVAGNRPTPSDADGDRRTEPDSGRFGDANRSGIQLELVGRIADGHGWDVGVAEDDDGTAFAFRNVAAIDTN
ncbi:diguanylate cyclase [Natrarchaeobius halalkaliphilus]|uniref:Diguanylate cyclase n=1 Tax=Natrarchaeobius halalkaliphilus TaxID=1679091 RepID=A0A3N6LTF2_9EURY|nr:GAF domain-containing protein [Natrarchaeobius halalkaliphilus]RQG93323.1 diguanylate cyclase [Natrarchaeobius halalkaliphilus]